jgi:Abnormal spindle-like microcephaly-assoc'd, ASPM-SPD-2-Hydin
VKSALHAMWERSLSRISLSILAHPFPTALWFLSLLILVSSFGGVTRVFATVPSSVNFGDVTVGTTSKKTVTITNSYSLDWTITAVTVIGTWYRVSGLSLPLTIKPGLSSSFTVSFTPTTTGTLTGSVTLTTNLAALSTISLTGTGVTLVLTLSPTSLKFPTTLVGHSTVLPVIITNIGTAAVTISSASVSGVGFTLGDLSVPLTLDAGQSSSFSLTFAPTKSGTFSGTASLTSNAANSPTTESLSGPGGIGHSVSLTWTASKSTGITGYNVYRGTASGGPYTKLNASAVSGTSYTDSTVSAGQTYYYVATALTSTKQSGYSNQAVAKVPSP